MGDAERLRPRRLAEEAQVSPHGKRESCSGNEHHSTSFTKIWSLFDKIIFQQREKRIDLINQFFFCV